MITYVRRSYVERNGKEKDNCCSIIARAMYEPVMLLGHTVDAEGYKEQEMYSMLADN